MKKLIRVATPVIAPVMAIALMAGCNSATEVFVEDLEGTWLASQARYSGLEDAKNNNFDLIENGFTAVFISDGSGDFVIRLDDPDGESEFVTGTLVIDGTNLLVTTQDGGGDGEVFLEGEQVAFSLTGGIEFDFNGDGRETDARLLLVMDRIGDVPN
jgi:hypothetical protein